VKTGVGVGFRVGLFGKTDSYSSLARPHSLEDLNAVLASEMRLRLHQDYDVFRDWAGPNTHFAMTRSRPWKED